MIWSEKIHRPLAAPNHASTCHLRKVLLLLLNVVLHPQEEGRLPLVQRRQLIELEELVGESRLVRLLKGLDEVDKQLVLPLSLESVIDLAEPFHGSVGTDQVL